MATKKQLVYTDTTTGKINTGFINVPVLQALLGTSGGSSATNTTSAAIPTSTTQVPITSTNVQGAINEIATALKVSQDKVQSFTNLAGFPATGVVGIVYIALDTDLIYVWDTTSSTYKTTTVGSTTATLTTNTAITASSTQTAIPSTNVQGALSDISTAIKTNQNNIPTAATVLETETGTDNLKFLNPADTEAVYLKKSTINAKGDLIVGTADNLSSILPVGINGQVLTVDSTTATGLKYINVSTGSSAAITTSTTPITASSTSIATTSTNQQATNSEFATAIKTAQDKVQSFTNLAGFPATGVVGIVYIALDTDITYVWDTTLTTYKATTATVLDAITPASYSSLAAQITATTNSQITQNTNTNDVVIKDGVGDTIQIVDRSIITIGTPITAVITLTATTRPSLFLITGGVTNYDITLPVASTQKYPIYIARSDYDPAKLVSIKAQGTDKIMNIATANSYPLQTGTSTTDTYMIIPVTGGYIIN